MKKVQGFSLIELMIVVAIIGIIAGIAYPSYMESVRKSNRADAKASLNDVSQRLQRCYTAYSSYVHASCSVGATLNTAGGSIASGESMYSITGALTATTFTLTATPIAGGVQSSDAKCTTLTLSQSGVRNATGSNPASCW
ncbi:type IV pilin protein [uncultured Microbulbifer sp.]|uniref:type IV pilin protein n=1 Tax=uncultured Microbulbifer sp. TaxID=348147 RepID=UPI0026267175|nr:type IV pilin protein [uncultured Microbulbifer sp.]